MKKIPAFVRGMVVRAVEESCRKSGLDRVTVEELERIRARMPTPKLFGRTHRSLGRGSESVTSPARLVASLVASAARQCPAPMSEWPRGFHHVNQVCPRAFPGGC